MTLFRRAASMRLLISLFVSLVLISQSAHAKGDSSRTSNRFGITVGLMSDPFPNMFGVSARFNVASFLQLSAGYGHLSASTIDPSTGGTATVTAKTYGGGARFFVPGWSLSPYAGFNVSKWDADGTFDIGGSSISNAGGMTVMYATFGLDWQTYFGFNIGGGVHYVISPTEFSDVLAIAPDIYIGWYF